MAFSGVLLISPSRVDANGTDCSEPRQQDGPELVVALPGSGAKQLRADARTDVLAAIVERVRPRFLRRNVRTS